MPAHPNLTSLLLGALLTGCAAPGPHPVSTEYLGPFTGDGGALHPDNETPHRIAYYGTDLGWTYTHRGRLHILFGDTWATESYAPIEAATGFRFDDGFGIIAAAQNLDPNAISAGNLPRILLGQHAGSSEMMAIDPGHAMDLGKTPMGGFSNGAGEFGIFNTTKPQGCAVDAHCGNGLSCDGTLGYVGTGYFQQEYLTLACRDGSAGCNADPYFEAGAPVAGSGLCVDPTSLINGERISNLLGPMALRVLIGRRDAADPRRYHPTRTWLTHKFMNVTVRAVESPDPTGATGNAQRVYLWGRPGFIGVAANHRPMPAYFAWAEMPRGEDFRWQPRYFAGMENGVPKFSDDEREAVPMDLDSTRSGVQPGEPHDIVNQMSVTYVAPLGKWVMFYGGGLIRLPTAALPNCGVLELFSGGECTDVDMGNGAVRMRTADHPWGPWSPPRDVIVGGDPAHGAIGQFGPGGALRHPACTAGTCAPHSDMFAYSADEHGFYYGVNIIEEWTRATPDGAVLLWNASTWDPYRVVLLRTHIRR